VLDRRKFLAGTAAVSTLSLAACAAPVSTRADAVSGSFAWFDLVTDDPKAAEEFYKDLFGWRFSGSESYRVISSGGTPLGGLSAVASAEADDVTSSQWVGILSVDDALAATEVAVAKGARQARAPVRNSSGTFSSIFDNRGALLTLYTGTEGFALDGVGQENVWFWADLFTDNPAQSRKFYAAVAGFQTQGVEDETYFVGNGEERGGLVDARGTKVEPNWLPYVGVSNVAATVERARSLGATTVIVEDDAAILVDPTGAGIGIAEIGG